MKNQDWRVGKELEIKDLGKCLIEKLYPGYNRVVLKISTNGGKRMAKYFGEKISITLPEADRIKDLVLTYRHTLQRWRIPVLDEDQIKFVIEENKKSRRINLIEITPFLGKSMEDLIISGTDDQVMIYAEKLLKTVEYMYKDTPGDDLPVGIDFIPRNFTDNHEMYYVDFMPPKIIEKGIYHLEIPEVTDPGCRELGIYRHFNAHGLMQVLLVQLGKLQPHMMDDFRQLISNFLKSLKNDVARHIRLSPVIKMKKSDLIKEIKKATFIDIYFLREVACQLACWGRISTDKLNEIFKRSHFQTESLPLRVIENIKKELIKSL